jgi:hypothetical protein
LVAGVGVLAAVAKIGTITITRHFLTHSKRMAVIAVISVIAFPADDRIGSHRETMGNNWKTFAS